MPVDWIHDELLQSPETFTQPGLERAALTEAVTKLLGHQETYTCQSATKYHIDGPNMVNVEDAHICPRQDESSAECKSPLQMDGSAERLGTQPMREMDRISFSDGTISCMEKLANIHWGRRAGYPFIISNQPPCDKAQSAIKNSRKDCNIPGFCSQIRGSTDQFAFSVLPLYLQDHRKCPICPNINRVARIVSEYWLHLVEGTRHFKVFILALVSQFYNTPICVGAGYDSYHTALRRAEIHDRGFIFFCDNEKDGDSVTDPVVEVEVRCDSFSLRVSGIGLADGIHDLARGMLCPLDRKPRIASRIRWRCASDQRHDAIRFLTEGNRLTVAMDSSLSSPTPESEKAKYHLEMRLEYEREVRSPQEMEDLLKDVRGHLTQKASCTLEQRLWGATESIDFIHSPLLRMAMTRTLSKLSQPTLAASRSVRDAICLHDIFRRQSQAWSEQDHGEWSHQRQQNERNLIQSIQDMWSVLQKSINTAAPRSAESFRSFMLHVLALLQYFPARLPEKQDAEYYCLAVEEYGVCLNFDAWQQTVEYNWSDFERGFRTNGPTRPLGLKFDVLPDIFNQIPPFEGLCDGTSPPPAQEKCYSGRIMSEVDLHLLCKGFGNLPAVSSSPALNHVLIRPMRRYDVDRDWIYQESSDLFTVYSCFGEHGQCVCSIKVAKYNFEYQWFFFKAMIIDDNSGNTPCQDPGILQLSQVLPPLSPTVYNSNKKQDRSTFLLRGLDRLVEELHPISSDCGTLPETLRNRLSEACILVRGNLPCGRSRNDVDRGLQLDLELHCRLVVQCCTFIEGCLRDHDHYRLDTPLSQLKWHAEAARYLCASFTGQDFGLARNTACESRDDRQSLSLHEDILEKPFHIPNIVSANPAPTSRSAPSFAIDNLAICRCASGTTDTNITFYDAFKVASDTEHDWKKHNQHDHEQSAQCVCPESACRDADTVWIETEGTRTPSGMEIKTEIVPNE